MFWTFRVGMITWWTLRENSMEEVVLRASKDGQGSEGSHSATEPLGVGGV